MTDDSLTQEALINDLRSLVGERGILTAQSDIEPYLSDWRGLYHGRSPCVLRPADTQQLAEAMKLLSSRRVQVVPQGGNTSMVGGAMPDESGRQVVLSLARMNRIRDIDPVDMTMVAEAGVILKTAQDAAAEAGCLFPLSLGAEGSATIGGVLSTNAGGNNTVRYGNARELMLGLEVVLPDGQVWNGLRRLRKDNTGYALRQLFVGAEGTLGIVTAAVLRLFARPKAQEVAFCAVPDLASALALFRRFRDRDEASLQAFEYMSGTGVSLVLKHISGATLPLAEAADHYVLVELASPRPDAGLRSLVEAVLGEAFEAGEVVDAAIAESQAQAQALWRIREEHSESQRLAGASVKNDVSVPVSRVPDLIRLATEAGERLIPGIRAVPFGHMGDGNIHMNFVQPEAMAAAAFLERSHDLMDAVNAVVRSLDGSFSAEHGIGRLKPDMLADWRAGAEFELMQRIKAAIDPAGLMNPGKVFETPRS